MDALSRMAAHQLEAGRTETANYLFRAVFDQVADRYQTSRRLTSVSDGVSALKARIGAWIVARRTEDDVTSEDLRREIRFALCSPSTQLRNEVADYLTDQGEEVLAMEIYESLLPMTVFGTSDGTSLYDVARSYSLLARKSNPSEAARWFDLAVGGTLDSINYRPGAYITLPLYVRRWAVEAAIKNKDRYEIQRHVDRILQLDPLDIDFAERLLPEMRKAGMSDIADDTLDKIVQQGIEYAIRFPLDAMTCNNLAWVAAMNDRHLEDALWLSQAAVTAEPESAIYRDTIAEVLFRLDRKVEAYQVEKSCLLDDPTQWHLHEQVRKYADAINLSHSAEN